MPQDDKSLLLRLKEHQVEFVIIGGFCGALHGISLVTQDLEICCSFRRENLYRLQQALRELNPRHRLTANKLPLELSDELCARLKNLYLQTDIGILDCLGEIAGIGGYEQAMLRSVVHRMSYGDFHILDIDALIASKEAVGRERDLATVKQLRAIKEKSSGRR